MTAEPIDPRPGGGPGFPGHPDPPAPAWTTTIEGSGGVSIVLDVWPAAQGAGRGFILVHGLASNARLWDGVATELSRLGHPVAALDLRGHGRSGKPDGPYDFATVSDDLVHVLEHLSSSGPGWEEPVAAGQSWGADVVLELACREPSRLAGVACVDGAISDLADRFPDWESCKVALRPPRLAGTPASELESRIRRSHPHWPEAGIQGVLANFELRADGTIAPWLSLEHHLEILHALWAYQPAARHREVSLPVLLMPAEAPAESGAANSGASEGIGNPPASPKRAAVAAALERLSRAEVRWFSPASHDVHAEHPGQVASVLDEAARTLFAEHVS